MDTKTFAELGLSAKVTAAVEAAGYTTPTPIQAQAIPVAVTGRDILGIAQTGTGKTAAFVMPMITRLETGRARARMPRSLILAPTRELAAQVAASFEKYGVNHKLDLALLIGGTAMDEQIRKLDRGVDVLIATPGRLLDHFGRGRIMLMGVEILVIDEADRMLDMGFIPDIEKICKLLPPRRQTLFFSATMPPEITRLTEQFLNDPTRIEVAKPATAAATITQRFWFCRGNEDWEKREVLRDIINSQTIKNAIIFCNRKRDVAILHKSLTKHGYNAGALHGDMDQSSRTATLDKFRAGELMLLAASDVAARGLDVPDVSHVFNFDIPWQPDDYVHRIGRTGRAGREGFSASIVTAEDIKSIQQIAKLTGEEPVWLNDPPTEEELAEGGKRRRGRVGRGASDGKSGGGREARGGGRGRDRARGSKAVGDAGGERGAETSQTQREPQPEREPRPVREARPVREPRPEREASGGRASSRERAPKRTEREGQDADVVELIGGESSGGDEARPVRSSRPTRAARGRGRDRGPSRGNTDRNTPKHDEQDRAQETRSDPRQDTTHDDTSREDTSRDDTSREDQPRRERSVRDRSGRQRANRDGSGRGRSPEDRPRQEQPRDEQPRRAAPGMEDQPRLGDDRPRGDQSKRDQPAGERTRDARPPRQSPQHRDQTGDRNRGRGNDGPRRDRPNRDRPARDDAAETSDTFADNLPAFLRRPVR